MKNLFKIFAAILLIAQYSNSHAQAYQWAKGIGSSSEDYTNSMAVDASGNVYVTGIFHGSTDFDPSGGSAYINADGADDLFFAKYDASGNYVWAKQLSGDAGEAKGIAVDGSGNVYITGHFEGDTDFDPGSGSVFLTASGERDIFIAKYDAGGNYTWAKRIGSTYYDESLSIAVDGSGNVYITGYFSGTVDFDPGAGTANLTSSYVSDIFFAKYGTGGTYTWAKSIAGSGYNKSKSIAVDGSGNIYLTGYFSGTADFDPGAGTANLTSVGSNDIFFAKYNSGGTYTLAKSIGSATADESGSIAVDGSGNVYITGKFTGTADFDPGVGTVNLTSSGSDDVFFAKYSSSGAYTWAKRIGGSSVDVGHKIKVDGSGNVFLSGSFYNTVDFDPGSGTANLTGYSYIFFAKYDASGNYTWAKTIGNTSNSYSTYSLAIDGSGNVHVCGSFFGETDFDPGAGTANLTTLTTGSWDIFFAKYNTSGTYTWAKSIGSSFENYSNSLAVDGSGNVYVTGIFHGSPDFDPGAGTACLDAYGVNDVFFAKYDAEGNYVWAKQLSGDAGEAKGIAVDGTGNVYVTGYFEGDTDFDPGSGSVFLTASGERDIFIAKYDANGNYTWAKKIGSTYFDESFSMAVDGSGNIYITGYFSGTVDFDPGAGTANLTSSYVSDIFFAKYSTGGTYTWAKSIAGSGYNKSKSIAVDGSGNIYLTGYYSGTADFDPGAGTANLTSAGNNDIFFAKYNSGGTYTLAKSIGSATADESGSIAVDGSGNVYITGKFTGTADFDPGAGTVNLTSSGSDDVFFAKYSSSGAYTWAKRIGGSSVDVGHKIKVDGSGNVFLTGSYYNTVDFDPGSGTASLTGYSYIFFAKYDASGNYTWAKTIGSTSYSYSSYGLAIDETGNVYITGSFFGETDFNPNSGTANLSTVGGDSWDIFFAKYSPCTNPTATTSKTNVNCYGQSTGTATVTPGGGVSPYTYLWNDPAPAQTTATATALAAGAYTVTVNDANDCSVTATVTITQPASALSVTATKTNVNCYGQSTGTATATPSGGTPGYTYLWNDPAPAQISATATALAAGNYRVTVTDTKSCTATASVTITQPASALSVTMTKTNVNCYGQSTGTATATPGGGTAGYTYLWTGGATTQTITGRPAGVYNVTVTDNNGCTVTGSVTITQPSSALSASITGSNVNCYGGNTGYAVLTVTGGVAPYTYSWSNSNTTSNIQFLTSGVYTVTVTDANSCTKTSSVTITQPAQLVASVYAQTNVSCYGGNDGYASIDQTGGTPPYTYYWQDGNPNSQIYDLIAGTYSVTIYDDNTCSATISVSITQPAAIALSTVSTNSNCGSAIGAIDLSVSGGTTPYTYDWSNGAHTQDISGLNSGAYTVTVTDADGCAITTTANVSDTGAPTASISSSTNVSCNGTSTGSATVAATGGTSPYTYLWTGGQTSATVIGLPAGSYNVTVTDNSGCAANATVVITQPAALNASIAAFTNTSCHGGSNGTATVATNGGTTPYGYSWTGGQTSATASGLSSGIYTVTVTDAKSCVVTASVTIASPAAVTASVSGTDVSCSGASDGEANLTPGGGTAPYTYLWSPGGSTNQDLINISAGAYLVTVTDANSCNGTGSVIIGQPVAGLSVSIDRTNVLCYGGSSGAADVTVSGGTTPYAYIWNTGSTSEDMTDLSVGIFIVTVTDANGCTTEASVAINQPTALTAEITKSDAVCNGASTGSATVTVTGGTAPYSYLWTGGGTAATKTNMTAGTYTVTVTDAKGCNLTSSVTIAQPAALTASVAGTNVNCYGGSDGSADLTAGGGTAPYSYIWSPGGYITQDIGGLTAATYQVTVTDFNGCIATSSVIINAPVSSLSASIAGTNVSTYGAGDGSADLSVSGGTPSYTYLWSNAQTTQDISSLSGGTYTVTVTDANGCNTIASVLINEPGVMSVLISGTNIICHGNSTGSAILTVTGGAEPFTYLWSNAATTEYITGIPAGSYSVTVTDNNSVAASASVTLTEPASILAGISGTNVNCKGGNDGSADLSVSGGITPYTYTWAPGGSATQDVSGLQAATYYVTVTDANGCFVTSSVIINEPSVALSAAVTGTNVSTAGAEDGAADLTVTGGTSPYTFIWSNSQTTEDINNLAGGAYTVTVTDAHECMTTATVVINELTAYCIPNPQAGASYGDFIDGVELGDISNTATGSASGPNYTDYTSMSTDLTKSTNYSITITSGSYVQDDYAAWIDYNGNGSFDDAGEKLGQLTSTTSYQAQTINFTVPGSANTGVTRLRVRCAYSPGNMDACSDYYYGETEDYSINIVNSSVPVADFIASGTTICTGACINFTDQSDASPDSWDWSFPGASQLGSTLQNPANICYDTPGIYDVTLSVSNSSGGNSLTIAGYITVMETPTVTASASPADICEGSISHLAASGAASYSWSPETNLSSPVISNPVAFPESTSVYTVTGTANGCSNTATVTVTVNPFPAEPVITQNGTILTSSSAANNQWYYEGALITGETSQNYSPSQDGNYTVAVTGAGGCTSTSSPFYYTEPSNYCIPNPSSGTSGNDLIDGVVLGDINNTGTGSASGPNYTDYTSMSTDLTKSASYTISITGGSYSPDYYAAWIDYNGNGSFADMDEKLGEFSTTDSYETQSLNFTVPSGAITGTTVLRVRCAYLADNMDPCTDYTYGETEDYSVNISGSSSPVAEFTVSNSSVCANSCIDFTDLSVGSPVSWVWSFPGATPSSSIDQNPSNICYNTAGAYDVTLTVTNSYGDSSITKTGFIIVNEMPTATISAQTNVTCYNGNSGSATVSASGGTAPYTYLWSNATQTPQATSLYAGTYSVTVTDNNSCTATTSAIITEPGTALSVAVSSQVNVNCFSGNNGSINITATGGTPSYTYNWGGGITTEDRTGLTAGTYAVTVTDANGCTATISATITQPASALSVAVTSQINVSCFGGNNGSINITVTGGTPAYNFNWSSGTSSEDMTGLTAGTYAVTVTDAHTCTVFTSVTITQPPALAVTSVETNAACYGECNGSSALAVTGGVLPYSYLWSNFQNSATANNLCDGSYSVTITDYNGCTLTHSVTISEPSEIIITLGGLTNATCGNADGTASVNVSGGASPYTYSWTGGSIVNNISNVAAGAYTVTVTDVNGCSENLTVNINNTGGPSLSISGTNVSCYGFCDGTATVIASGGTPGYNYLWTNAVTTPNITGLCSGPYTVTVTDAANCQATASITITQPVALNAVISSSSNVSCNGANDGCATVSVIGGTQPYSYYWSIGSTGATTCNLIAGANTVTISDANMCQVYSAVTITEPPPLLIVVDTIIDASAALATDGGIEITVSGGTPYYTYLWSNSDATEDIYNLQWGYYSMTVTDFNGCVDSITVFVDFQDVVPSAVMANTVVIYPNPTKGILYIKNAENSTVYVYNLLGEVVMIANNLEKTGSLDLSKFITGAYTIKVVAKDKTTTFNLILDK